MSTSFFDVISSGLINLYLKLNRESFKRFLDLKNKKGIVRNQILQGKNFYLLDVLGISPSCQKQGIASKLMEYKLKEIDQLGFQCYLETSNSKNIDYYKKFGFTVVKEYKINDLEVFCLCREQVSI